VFAPLSFEVDDGAEGVGFQKSGYRHEMGRRPNI
jgi:hypothetical protein